jgi:hypothetical protein
MEKPTFFESLKAGAIGMFKGAATLGIAGLVAGAALGAVLGGTALIAGGAPMVAAAFAIGFAEIGITVGGIIGGFTGVAQNREAQAPDAQDMINLANISFAQGAATAQNKNVTQSSLDELQQASTHFQNKLAAEKTNPTLAQAR